MSIKSNSCFIMRFNFFALCAVATLLVCCAVARSQAVGSTRGLPAAGEGSFTIQGRVHFPAGQSQGSSRVKVTLEGEGALSQTVATDQDGAFRFTSLVPGRYTVVVDAGKDYETGREPVDIDRGGSNQRINNVEIMLRMKISASNPAFANVPPAALDLYQKGMAAEQKSNTKSAVDFFSQAVEAYPNFSAALTELGVQYLKLQQYDKAGNTYEALLKLKPGDATAQLNLGISLYNLNKLDQAEDHLRESIKLTKTSASAHYYLGVLLIKTKRYDESQQELETAIANGGDNIALAHMYLGGLYMQTKKNKQAADELERYLQLDPKAANAERIRGTIKDLRSKQ